jgi:hypothetical protein
MSGKEIASALVKKMVSMHLDMNRAKILIIGIGKIIENDYSYDTDIVDLAIELGEYNIQTHVYDHYADINFLKKEYSIHCENDMNPFGQVSTYSGFVITGHVENFNIGEYKRGRFALIQL